ncbi:MAG TPA: HAMP domain-containing sensor histidine kinase, partial [Nitrososphaeraceae archaeon]|nr:HAMP domain-containing sensor histidine kinase [Nitrososphaeraceae archaeon]
IDNAYKFTENGDITVRIKKEIYNQQVKISIQDEGKGIDKEILPKLFTKFTTKSESGTGLGLYISKKIIEAHGGKIWVHNNNNNKNYNDNNKGEKGRVGAEFSFTSLFKNNIIS